jgi:hypothetical protein
MDEHEKARWHAWARVAIGWSLGGAFVLAYFAVLGAFQR